MVERTLVFLKPDAIERGLVGKILSRFEERGFKLVALQQLVISAELSDKHYQEHVSKPFYPSLRDYITGGPVVAFVLEGEGAVPIVRRMVGVTDAAEAASGTIRGDFALSKQYNIIHASDSIESARREIANFFPELG